VIERDGRRELVPMRWGLVPSWWSKPLKDMRVATFNARVETIADKPVFREAFRRTRCLIPASSSPTTSRAATASRSRSPGCGTSGATSRRARPSSPAPWSSLTPTHSSPTSTTACR
jgi:hypothetical protein